MPTTWIRDTYNTYATRWAQRNDLHVQALEQAASDKVLFLNESVKGPHRNVDLRFPEYVLPEGMRKDSMGSAV
jgi:hypothetical protein